MLEVDGQTYNKQSIGSASTPNWPLPNLIILINSFSTHQNVLQLNKIWR